MSYEGYSQFWCKNGHYWTLDSHSLDCFGEKKEKCPVCKEESVFENMVDVTNGSFEDGKRIDGYIEPKINISSIMECGNCFKTTVCECSTYEIPKEKNE